MSQRSGFFDTYAYWSQRQTKRFVVYLEVGHGKRRKLDSVLVSAKNEQRAIECAKHFTLLKGKIYATARLAEPLDCGCNS